MTQHIYNFFHMLSGVSTSIKSIYVAYTDFYLDFYIE